MDWERKKLRLADTKAGRIHYAPLSERALALLGRAPLGFHVKWIAGRNLWGDRAQP